MSVDEWLGLSFFIVQLCMKQIGFNKGIYIHLYVQGLLSGIRECEDPLQIPFNPIHFSVTLNAKRQLDWWWRCWKYSLEKLEGITEGCYFFIPVCIRFGWMLERWTNPG